MKHGATKGLLRDTKSPRVAKGQGFEHILRLGNAIEARGHTPNPQEVAARPRGS